MNLHNPRVAAAALCLVFTVGVPAARAQQRQTEPPTDAFGANPGAQFPEPAPSSLSDRADRRRPASPPPSLERDRDGSHGPRSHPSARG